jgi:hypothetical protein
LKSKPAKKPGPRRQKATFDLKPENLIPGSESLEESQIKLNEAGIEEIYLTGKNRGSSE